MFVADGITKPILELTKAAEQVNEGNYDVKIKPAGNDEVGILTLSFSRLVANLKEYIENLHKLNDQLKEDNLSLEAATIRDSLTGVKNRFALRRDYERYSEKNIHIMMLDVDGFKNVNDTYGHTVGDFLLKKMGDALIDQFGGEYSYRYGGDEFLIIYPDIEEEDFKIVTDNLKKDLKEIYSFVDQNIRAEWK
jgi:diguanylate cyclase (GGDEF)-like protein